MYKDIWTPALGEGLICELDNIHDPYAVAVVKTSIGTIGHIPRSISALCHFFLRRNGTITCQVTGPRRYSDDLAQGGLEVPCTYTFTGTAKEMGKVRRLLASSPSTGPTEPLRKKKKIEVEKLPVPTDPSLSDEVWLKFGGQCMTQKDKKTLVAGDFLNDRHINYAQCLLLIQFPKTRGLGHTLLQDRKKVDKIEEGLQIIHDRGNHWIVATNIGCAGTVKVYDSLYSHVNGKTKAVIVNLFGTGKCMDVVEIRKQEGGKDCDLFAIAIATALLFGKDPSMLQFNQSDM